MIHMRAADPVLLKRWFNRKQRLRKDPSNAAASEALRETTMDLAAAIADTSAES